MLIPPFELERFFAKHEFTARYLLCASDCESVALKDLLDFDPKAREQFDNIWLGYAESSGSPELRQEISRLYQKISPEQVLAHVGAQEAIYNFMHASLRSGDHVIVHWPCYQSLFQVAETIGCHVTRWESQESDRWAIDPDFLKKSLRPNTKVVVINSPHNPTGYLLDRSRLQEIVKICDHHGVTIFMDEVYKGLEYDPADQLPSACDLSEKAVSLGVFSKAFGLAGIRLGWIATRNKEIYSRMSTLKDYTTICNARPSEFLGTLALQHKEKLLSRNRSLIQENLIHLDRFLAEFKDQFEWNRPKAGCIALVRRQLGGSDQFCNETVEHCGVLLAPSSKFAFGDDHFRIGFGRSNCPESLAALAAHLRR